MKSESLEEYKQVSLEVIKETIKNPPSDETVHHFVCDEVEFRRLQALLEEHRVALYFDTSLKHLRFVTNRTWIHEAPVSWFNSWGESLAQLPELSTSQCSRGLIERLRGDFSSRKKEPDAAFSPDDSIGMPTIIVEVGYSETIAQLQFDAQTLLKGSEGEIKLAILIDIQPLQQGDTSIQKAVIQLWEYDSLQKKAVYKSKRDVIPPPKYPSKQKIDIPWTTILRNGPYPTSPLPPLNLDRLRSKLQYGVKQHLYYKAK